MGTRCADHVTPLHPQKLALTSPTGGGRSVGIVRARTKATEFSLVFTLPLSVQITAARHVFKTGCGVGVAAVGNTCSDILVVVGDPTSKSGQTVS